MFVRSGDVQVGIFAGLAEDPKTLAELIAALRPDGDPSEDLANPLARFAQIQPHGVRTAFSTVTPRGVGLRIDDVAASARNL